MALILTFLGKGGVGKTTVAIAAAKQFASTRVRTLLVGDDPTPAWGMQLGANPGVDPIEIDSNLAVAQLHATVLLERSWEYAKDFEAQYLRSPILKKVYGQELGILPGMDRALTLNALRELNDSGDYDVIVYDSTGDMETLRMLGMPEVASWYLRRFQRVLAESDVGKAIAPFIQPVSSTVFNVTWTAEEVFHRKPGGAAGNLLDRGREAVADPNRVAAYLVSDGVPETISAAKFFWGVAQQVGLTVGGVLLNRQTPETIGTRFEPLSATVLPEITPGEWQPLIEALPDFRQASRAPRPVTVDVAARRVSLFLPGFDKKQVQLTQYGPEITIEAGDWRRNLSLPSQLSGQPVKGAKFQDGYLIISF